MISSINSGIEFDDLPFKVRPDLTPYLLHLTKNTKAEDDYSAYENLVSILQSGKIRGSSSKKGFIKGKRKAVCFMDVPFSSLKYVLTPENTDPQKPRYEPYGLAITKQFAYKRNCRPALYLSNSELAKLKIPKSELWRVVRFEVSNDRWISWLHEREWRCPEEFLLPKTIPAVLVRTTAQAQKLTKEIAKNPEEFKCIPKAVVPLTVFCQGLLA